jgi:hypothetical protein
MRGRGGGMALGDEPARATGRYPDPVWAPVRQTLSVEDPPRATGRYPARVWDSVMPARSMARGQDAALSGPKQAGYQDDLGDAFLPEARTETGLATLDNREIYQIVREVAKADSGTDLYAAVAHQDGFGLCFGLVLFPQASGHLGAVLKLMRARDADSFQRIFGPGSDALVATANAPTREERLRPVEGENLWSVKWQGRFQAAGAVPAFQAAQNEQAIEGQFRPMLGIAGQLGFDTDRSLAMVYDSVITRGMGGGLRWVMNVAGPLRTAAERSFALQSLDFADLRTFQLSAGLAGNGVFDPLTLAALADSLRETGYPMPSAGDLAGRLVAGSSGMARERLMRLRDSAALQDIGYSMDGFEVGRV